MFQVQRLQQRARSFESLCGLRPDEFDSLAEVLDPLWTRAHHRSLLRENRQRQIGAGRQYKLDTPHRLLLTLIYLRHYLPMHFLGVLFDLDAANVCRNIHRMLPLLEQVLPAPLRARTLDAKKQNSEKKASAVETTIPPAGRRIRTLEAFITAFPDLADLIVDGTEQPRGQPKRKKGDEPGKNSPGRPKDKKRFYSVKKGMYTLKTQVTVTPEGQIVHLSATVPGRMHDMQLLKQSRLLQKLPRGTRLWEDRGYTGLERLCPQHEVVIPKKRPRKGQLTDEEREQNRLISKVRIAVENAICRIKKFKVCSAFYRNAPERHGLFWGCVTGLINLRHNRTAMAMS